MDDCFFFFSLICCFDVALLMHRTFQIFTLLQKDEVCMQNVLLKRTNWRIMSSKQTRKHTQFGA